MSQMQSQEPEPEMLFSAPIRVSTARQRDVITGCLAQFNRNAVPPFMLATRIPRASALRSAAAL